MAVLDGTQWNKAEVVFARPSTFTHHFPTKNTSRFAPQQTRTEQPSAHCHAKVQRQRIIRPSSDYFDETRQFFPGIEVDPFAGLIQISQALVFLALNPDQVLVIWIQPDDGAVLRK